MIYAIDTTIWDRPVGAQTDDDVIIAAPAYYPVDVFVNMNGTATGTAVSAGNLATGTVGTYSSWTAATAGETFGASIASLTGSVIVNGGGTYPASTATQTLVQDNTVS